MTMDTIKVGYFVGSLAKASINRKLARALVRLAPPQLALSEIGFGDLPLYSYDYDADYPPVARAFKDEIAAVDALLFVTPEYTVPSRGPSRTPSTGRAAPMDRTRSLASPRRSSGHPRGHGDVPAQLHDGVRRLRRARLHRAAKEHLECDP
jgi:hypothetical protein